MGKVNSIFLNGLFISYNDQLHNLPSSEIVTKLLEFLPPIILSPLIGVRCPSKDGLASITGSLSALKSYILMAPLSVPAIIVSEAKGENIAHYTTDLDLNSNSGLDLNSLFQI